MDDLEALENQRYGAFALAGVLIFIGLCVLGVSFPIALFVAIGLGLLVSGIFVARRLTSSYYWALVEAEARLNGHAPSKRATWVGNLLPGIVVVALVGYFNHVV